MPKWLSPGAAWTYLWNLLLVRRTGSWSQGENILFVELLEWIGTQRDPTFWTMDRKVGWSILSIILRSDRKKIPPYLWTQLELQQRNGYIPDPHPRSFYGWRNSRDWKRLLSWRRATQVTKSPPKRRIGVGYRDQGTRRNLAHDGSPAWQEVAQSLHQIGETKPVNRSPLDFFLDGRNFLPQETGLWGRDN